MSKLTPAQVAIQLCLLECELYKECIQIGQEGVVNVEEKERNTWRFSHRLNQVQTQLDPEAENKYNIIITIIIFFHHAENSLPNLKSAISETEIQWRIAATCLPFQFCDTRSSFYGLPLF